MAEIQAPQVFGDHQIMDLAGSARGARSSFNQSQKKRRISESSSASFASQPFGGLIQSKNSAFKLKIPEPVAQESPH
jgi:hypothetical protein